MSALVPNPPSSGGGAAALITGATGWDIPSSPGASATMSQVGSSLGGFGNAPGVPGFASSSFCQLQPRVFVSCPAGGNGGFQENAAAKSFYRGGTLVNTGLAFSILAGIDNGLVDPGDGRYASGIVNASVNAIGAGQPSAVWTNGIFVGADSTDANLQLIVINAGVAVKTDLGVSKLPTDVYWLLSYFEVADSGEATVAVDYWGAGSFTRQSLFSGVINTLPAQGVYLAGTHQFASATVGFARNIAFSQFNFTIPV